MSVSVDVSFLSLFVIFMSFTTTSFGSRVSIRPPAEKALSLSVANDLPNNSGELHFDIVNEKPKYVLKQGEPLNFLTNFVAKRGELKWIKQQPLSATFNLYDPSAEGDHRKISWSVREDGVYHSWDNVNFNKNVNWST